jgi:hypothetical protein
MIRGKNPRETNAPAISTVRGRLATYLLASVVAWVLLGGNAVASIHPCSAALISGNGQTASVNQTLSALTIEIDGIGPGGGLVPAPGEPITWSIIGPGGGPVSPSSPKTGPDGRIQATVVLGSLPGSYQISFSSANGGTCFQSPPWPTFTETAIADAQRLTITTESLPPGVAGEPYSAQLAATGGQPPYNWSVAAIGNPPNSRVNPLDASKLTLDSSTGIIRSDRVYGGKNSFVVFVTDSVGAIAQALLTIDTPCGFNKDDFQFSRITPFAQYQAPSGVLPVNFGFQPSPHNPVGYQKCDTVKAGCALTSAAAMLSTIPGGDTVAANATPLWLNSQFISSSPVAYGKGTLRSNGAPDWCEFDCKTWAFYLPKVDNFNITLEPTNAVFPDFSSTDDFLESAVCEKPQSVILRLVRIPLATPRRYHFVLATGRVIDQATGLPDWQLLDGGEDPNHIIQGNIYSLRDHLSGFTWQGANDRGVIQTIELKYNLDAVRAYSATATPPFLLVCGGSPVELLLTDPIGRQLGNTGTGADLLGIPNGTYFRDGLLQDDTDGESFSADTTEKKATYVVNPMMGVYSLNVSGTGLGTYTLQFDAVATDHTILTTSLFGVANQGSTARFSLQYSPSLGMTGGLERIATFVDTLADIRNSVQLGLIELKIVDRLSDGIERAGKEANEGDARRARKQLREFKEEVRLHTARGIKESASQMLIDDANSLIRQLPVGEGDDDGEKPDERH